MPGTRLVAFQGAAPLGHGIVSATGEKQLCCSFQEGSNMRPVFKEGIKERLATLSFVRVELGCGPNREFEDSVTLDCVDLAGIDIVADLDDGIPLGDSSVDEVRSSHFLEHVADLATFMGETYRVLKSGGRAVHVVPHFGNPYFYSDYTHRAFFGLYTFHYFSQTSRPFKREVPSYYNELDFTIDSIRLVFKSPFPWRNKLRKYLEAVVNYRPWMQEFYEENLGYFIPPYEIRVELLKP